MTWKKEEQEITHQEALALTRAELAPYWAGSDPLLIGLEQNGVNQVFPLDGDFVKQLWLIVIVDPVTFWGYSILELIREWETRYRGLSLKFLVIYSARYRFQKSSEAARKWFEEIPTNMIRCFDSEARLSAAFGASDFPKALLFRNGEKIFECSGPDLIPRVDFQIHQALRIGDPGLPLRPVLQGIDGLYFDSKVIDLNSKSLPPLGVELTGSWESDQEKVWTKDGDATLSFTSPASEVAILAFATETAESVPYLGIELNGLPPFDSARGKHLRVSENADLIVPLNDCRLYSILTELPKGERRVTVRFKNLKTSSVEIYGLRFGEQMRVEF